MRRADREISEVEEIAKILDSIEIMRIAIFDSPYPYIIPLNFAYFLSHENKITFFFHSANQGRKIELIRQNAHVGFEADKSYGVTNSESEIPCKMSTLYESVVGFGRIKIISDNLEKREGLKILINRFSKVPLSFAKYDPILLDRVVILKLVVEGITGKRHIIPNKLSPDLK